jgi:uncharacterized protein YwgA
MNAQSEPQFAGEDLSFAVLHWLVSDLQDAGKIQLQKLVYFLQESYGIPLGYTFRMHHYGPYSRELDNDLLKLRLMGFINVQADDSGYGFHVTPLCDADLAWTNALASYESQLRDALTKLGHLPASELEIQATIHYVSELVEGASAEEIVAIVHSLKPKFLPEDIVEARKQLEEHGLLQSHRTGGQERGHGEP